MHEWSAEAGPPGDELSPEPGESLRALERAILHHDPSLATPAAAGWTEASDPAASLPAGTVTFVFTDIEGSTRLLAELGSERYSEELGRHRALVRRAVATHGGRVIGTEGDAFFVAFARASDALGAASEVQAVLGDGPVRVRVGIHTGEPLLVDGGYVGLDVHKAARICEVAHGGQVVVSQATRDLAGLELRDLGLHRLKDLADPERLFQLGTGDFPPLRTLSATNLPVQLTPFLGRVDELAEVSALLRGAGARLVTLTGAGGSGKTRLALRVAELRAAAYRDGTWFVPFADISDPEQIAPAICQTLGLAEQAGLTPVRRLEQWLAEREVLLVLDNLERLAAGSSVLTKLLGAGPGLTLLVTSREPLRLAAEQQYEVPVLQPRDAVELFTTRGKAVKPGVEIDPEVAAEICERVDYLPLAVELAAARTKALAPGEILARLDTRLPLLTSGPRDAPRRQQTLKATIDWSYDLLEDEERRLFAHFAVFAGGCTFAAAEGVLGAALDTLQGLVDRSLVRHDGERYSMLPTLREYALERLEQAGDAEELRRLHARWFVEFVHSEGLDAHAPATPSLYNRIRAELENFRGALEWSAESGDSEAVARLAWPLTFYWWIDQGQLQEAERWVEVALEPRADYPPWLRAAVLNTATHLAWRRGDEARALAFFEQAAAILPLVGDPNIICLVMMSRGNLAAQRGDIEGARAAFEDAARFARERNLPELPFALVNLSDLAIAQGSLDEGRALCEEALACSEGPTSHTARVALINLSEIAALQGRYGDALSLGRTALAAALDHGDQTDAVWAAFPIAWPLAELGELDRSGRLIGAATAFLEEAGFARSRSDLLSEKAILDVLHRRLAADAVQALVQQGRDTPLAEVLADALN